MIRSGHASKAGSKDLVSLLVGCEADKQSLRVKDRSEKFVKVGCDRLHSVLKIISNVLDILVEGQTAYVIRECAGRGEVCDRPSDSRCVTCRLH